MKIINQGAFFNGECHVFRIAIDTERNSESASNEIWDAIRAQLANEPKESCDWWIAGIGYSTILFFVRLSGLFDPTYDEKVSKLRAKVTELLGDM